MPRTPEASRSRAGAVWVRILIAALLLAALIVFLLQNTRPVLVTFLTMQGTVPLAIALASAVAVAVTPGIDWIELIVQVALAAVGVSAVAGIYGRRGARA